MALLAVTLGSAALSAGMGAYKAYQGSQQEKEGKAAMKGLSAPTYQIPKELQENLSESEIKALEGLPTAQKNEYIKNLERSQQAALNASADRKGGLLGVQASAQQATDAFTNLVSMDAQARAQNEQVVQQNRMALAEAKDRQFGVQEGRYQQGLQSAQSMIGAGMQNKMSGYDTIAASAIQAGTAFAGAKAMQGQTEKIRNVADTNAVSSIKTPQIGAAPISQNTSSSMTLRNGVAPNSGVQNTSKLMFNYPSIFNFQ